MVLAEMLKFRNAAFACLQTLTGRQAKAITKDEFLHLLFEVIVAAASRWPQDGSWSNAMFVFDNLHAHNLDENQMDRLDYALREIARVQFDSRRQLVRPPRYSPDFMQCIEHVHSTISKAWWEERVLHPCEYDVLDAYHWLKYIFETRVTRDSVEKNVDQLMCHLRDVIGKSHGSYVAQKVS